MKYVILAACILVGGLQFTFLFQQFSYTKSIEAERPAVSNQIQNNRLDYKIKERHETAELQVRAKNFEDAVLLTNESGNILSLIFKIVSIGCFGWFLYKLDDSDLLDNRVFALFNYASIFLLLTLGLQYFGFIYTKNWFVENLNNTGFSPIAFGINSPIVYLGIILSIKYILLGYKKNLR
jgi:hypothetical protein